MKDAETKQQKLEIVTEEGETASRVNILYEITESDVDSNQNYTHDQEMLFEELKFPKR